LCRKTVVRDLRAAITGRQFELYFHPEIDIRTQAVAAFEVLLRWHHPTNGLTSPGDSSDSAQESGLIIDIGDILME
jgi:EAL domain-containing protein (putative c-di-GMP-specific phosphodiesterase class I)